MSIIVLPNNYQTGQVIDAGKEMANLNTIVNDYNGNITNANLASSIAITDNHLNQITTASKVSGTAITGLASLPSGAGVIPAANLTYANISYPYVKVSDVKSSGTVGGAATTTTWTNRTLNTTDTDTASISSLSGNQVTLPTGTYQVRIISPFTTVAAGQLRLYNVTASTVLLLGQNFYAIVASGGSANAQIVGQFTLGTSSALAVQYFVNGAASTGDLGNSVGTGSNEVYTIAEFIKLL